MSTLMGWGDRVRGLFTDTKGPWGSKGGDGDDGGERPGNDGPGSGPWGEPPRRGRRSTLNPAGGVPSLEELLRRGRARFGGDGGGLPGRPDRSLILWAVLAFICVWLVF